MENISNNIEEINNEFCQLVGLKKAKSFILNNNSGEIRYYAHSSGKYKCPKGWTNVTTGILDKAVYPDMTEPYNFCLLLNVQWDIFESLGASYSKVGDESFEINYIMNKIQGIKMARSFGAGQLLDDYIAQLKQTQFYYDIGESYDKQVSITKKN